MEKMIEALVEDGIISNENRFNLNFTNSDLKVNGKKLSAAQLKKYKAIYEANSTESLGQFKMSVKKSGTNSIIRTPYLDVFNSHIDWKSVEHVVGRSSFKCRKSWSSGYVKHCIWSQSQAQYQSLW